MSANATAAAMRGVPAQFTDIVTSLQGGQSPMTVLLQQGGQLKDMFGGVGNAAKALGGYVVGLINPITLAAAAAATMGYAFYKGAEEVKDLNKALALTNNYAGLTQGTFRAMAESVSAYSGATIGEAKQVVQELAASGKIGAASIINIGKLAKDYAVATGQDIDKITPELIKMFADPAKGAQELNSVMHFLSTTQQEYINTLQRQGETEKAQLVLSEALAAQLPKNTESLGALAKGWKAVAGAASWAWDQMMGVGRPDTIEEQIAKLQRKIKQGAVVTDDFGNTYNINTSGAADKAALASLGQALEAQQAEAILKSQAAAKNAKDTKAWEAISGISKESQIRALQDQKKLINDFVAETEQQKKEQRDALTQIDKNIVDIRRGMGNESYQAAVGKLRDALAVQEETYKAYYKDIAALQKSGDMDARSALEATYAVDELKLEAELEAAENIAALSKGRTAQEQAQANKQVSIIKTRIADQYRLETEGRAALEEKLRNDNQSLLNDLASAASKAMTPLEAAGVEFAKRFGKNIQEAMKNGTEAEVEAVRRAATAAWSAMSTKAQFEEAKQSFDALFTDMQQQLEAVKIAAENGGGGILASLNASDAADEIRAKLLPALEDARKKMAEFSVDSPANAKTVTDYSRKLQKESADTNQFWKKATADIEQSLTGALEKGFESGRFDSKKFIQALQDDLKKAVFKIAIQAVVGQVTGGISGMLGGSSATGSAGSALSLASSGNSLFNLASGGSSITSGFLGGMASVGSEAALGAAFVGPSATLAGGSVGAGASVGSLFGSSAGALSTALPWIGGALAIASLLGGMFGKGGAPKQNYGTGFIGNATGTIADAPYAKIAGQIGSGQAMTGQDELQKAIYTDSVKAIVAKYAPSSSYDVLLNSQINVKGKSQNINDAAVYGKNGTLYNFGPDTGQGQDAAQSFFKDSIPKLQLAIITDAFRNANADYKAIADSIVGTSTDMTDALSGLSADAVAAMQQNLSGMATLFDAIKTQINGSITGEAVASITKLAGGFATLTTQVNDYYSNFYSQEEKASKAHEQLATEFEKLNLAMPSTRDGFRKIVESLDITTEAGQKSFAALMGLSGAFASITDAAEVAKRSLKDIAAERDGLQARLDQAMGNTAAIRQRELDALDPSNRALQQQIYALEDTKAAAEAAAAAQQKAADAAVEAARAAEQAYKDMLAGLLSAVDNAYAGVERAVGAEKSKIDASYSEQVSALDAQYQASKAVFESQRATAQQNLSAITQVADRLKSAVKSMQIESDGLLKNQRLMASNTLNAALSASQAGASLANFPGLEDALATVAKPAEQLFSTFQDYAREQGRLGATIGSLGQNADAQVSVAQMTLDSINGASQQAEQIYQRQKEQLASQHAADIKALDDILKNGMDQVDALKGIDKSVLSVAGAMAGLASAIAAYRNASGGGGSGTYVGASTAGAGGATLAAGAGSGSTTSAAAASTPISKELSASLSGYMGYDELALQYGKGWADQAMNDPSGSLWTQAILNKLYGGGVDMSAASLEGIFGAGNVPSSAQAFGDSLTQAQWDQVAAAADKTKAFGDIIGGILGTNVGEQDASHTGIYDQNGFLLANTGNYYVGSGAFTGSEWGIGQLPGSVSLAGEQAIIADNKNIADMLSGAPSASAVEMLYQSILGRSAESAGVDYWSQQMAAGLTTEQLAAQLMASDEYLKKINGFASGGTASAGYYLAGENGPELIHSDSATRIYPAEQTSALMARLQSPNGDMAAVLAELRAVKAELEQLRGASEDTARHTRDTKNILRNVTQDGETLQTTVVA